MVEIEITTEENECRKDIYEAIGEFMVSLLMQETLKAFNAGYNKGHKDGMTEAVTTITE